MITRALVFTLGPYRLLVEAVRVFEVLERGVASRVRGGGHMSWRGRLVPEIGLGTLLGHAEAGGEGAVDIVYGDPESDAVVMFRADRVLGLRSLDPGQVHRVPALAPELLRLFPVIVLDPADGRGILWLEARPELLLGLWRTHCTAEPEPEPEQSGPRRAS